MDGIRYRLTDEDAAWASRHYPTAEVTVDPPRTPEFFRLVNSGMLRHRSEYGSAGYIAIGQLYRALKSRDVFRELRLVACFTR